MLHPAIVPLVVRDIWASLDPKDQDYFRETRERRLGRKLEDFAPEARDYLAAFKKTLAPLRRTLKAQSFSPALRPTMPTISSSARCNGRGLPRRSLLDDEPEISAWMAAVLGTYGL